MAESSLEMRKITKNDYKTWLFLVLFLVFMYILLHIVVPWVTDTYQDLKYGEIRTYTIAFDTNPTDESSILTYFTAQNIEGRISVLAVSPLPSNPTLELQSPVLLGKDVEKEPILLRSALVNDDSFPDLIVSVAGDDITYLAGNGTFTKSDSIR